MRVLRVQIVDKNGIGDEIGGYIRFRIIKTNSLFSNKADINFFNLSDITLSNISKENRKVIVTAGYDDNQGVIFSGKVDKVIPLGTSGADVQTRVSASDTETQLFSPVQIELLKNESRKDAIEKILSKFSGEIAIGPIVINEEFKIKDHSLYYGTMYDVIDSLLMHGEMASFQDGQFMALSEDKAVGKAVRLNKDTGLMPGIVVDGNNVRFKSTLNPKIRPNTLVQIESSKIESPNIGPYVQPDNTMIVKTIKCVHSGDNRVGEHSTTTEGRIFYGAVARS